LSSWAKPAAKTPSSCWCWKEPRAYRSLPILRVPCACAIESAVGMCFWEGFPSLSAQRKQLVEPEHIEIPRSRRVVAVPAGWRSLSWAQPVRSLRRRLQREPKAGGLCSGKDTGDGGDLLSSGWLAAVFGGAVRGAAGTRRRDIAEHHHPQRDEAAERKAESIEQRAETSALRQPAWVASARER